MTVFPVLAVGFFMKIVAAVFIVCAVALILIILVQKGRGTGLSGALGGGVTTGIFGSKTGDFLTWTTIGLAALFLTLLVIMAKFYKPTVRSFEQGSAAQQQPVSEQPTGSPRLDTSTPTSQIPEDSNLFEQ